MEKGSSVEALRRGIERNAAAVEIYRAIARKSPERWLSGMAGAWREQRESLTSELSAILPLLGNSAAVLELPPLLDTKQGLPSAGGHQAVEEMKTIETDDLALYLALAAANLAQPSLAQQFDSIAARVKLRIGIADSHLDLHALG